MVEHPPWPGATSGVDAVGLQPEDQQQHGPTVERRPEEYLLDWA